MSEPIEEIKRRKIKQEVQQADHEDKEIEREIGQLKGHKVEHIDPKTSRTRDLFKRNIKDNQKTVE